MLRWFYVLLVGTLVWRVVRYATGCPVWGDESRVMLNLIYRDFYSDLLKPLANDQVAPLGFLAAQFTVARYVGTSELALRLFPLITGILGIIAFARLAWILLPPMGALFAFGALACAHYVTHYALDIKPYGSDFLVASVLMLLAFGWIQDPRRRGYVWGLLLFIPVAVFFSYPSVFMGGALCIGMLSAAWHSTADRRLRLARLAVPMLAGLVLALSFVAMMQLSGSGQYHATREGMLYHWQEGMPPSGIIACLKWLVVVHTSEMFAYPFGGKNFASIGTFILSVIGLGILWKEGRRSVVRSSPLAITIISAFALTMIAAVMKRYPYGGSARVAMHLAPAIGLMAGTGIAWLVRRFGTADASRALHGICAAFLAMILGGIVYDIVHPYKAIADKQVEVFFKAWPKTRPAGSGIWLATDNPDVPTQSLWYLRRSVAWDLSKIQTTPSPAALEARNEWWVLAYDPTPEIRQTIAASYARLSPRYEMFSTQTLDLEQKGHSWELQKWRCQTLPAGTQGQLP